MQKCHRLRTLVGIVLFMSPKVAKIVTGMSQDFAINGRGVGIAGERTETYDRYARLVEKATEGTPTAICLKVWRQALSKRAGNSFTSR